MAAKYGSAPPDTVEAWYFRVIGEPFARE